MELNVAHLAIAILASLASVARTESQPVLVVDHVHVVALATDAVEDDRTVVIEGGRIAAIGEHGKVKVPDGATVIDGTGKWLMPGLADMHVHAWTEADLTLFVANGVTTVRNMFGSPLQLQWRKEIAAGERLGPRIYTAGPIIDGKPPVWPGSAVIEDPADAEKIVLEQKEAGYDFLKVYSRLKPDAYAAIAAAAKKNGMRFMGHVPNAVSLFDAASAGQESFEHLTGLSECCQRKDSPFTAPIAFKDEAAAWNRLDDEKLIAAARTCSRAGLWSCPTFVTIQKWAKGKAAEELAARPEMRYVDPQILAYWTSPQMYLASMPDEYIAAMRGADVDRKHAVKVFHDHGAPLLVGTDQGNPYVVAGFSLHEELSAFVDAGLTPYQALRAATADAARFMHGEDAWGTLAVGRVADLVLLDANPLANIANTTKIAGVAVRGEWHDAKDLATRLDAIATAFAKGK